MKYIIYDNNSGYGNIYDAYYFGDKIRIDMFTFITYAYHDHPMLGYYKWI